jgi:nitrile hydratase accessory protein
MSVLDRVRAEDTLPRRNGELVFDEPWESRALSVAVALAEEGRCDWDDFRSRLIAEIGAWDEASEWRYYAHWLAALELLLVDHGLVTTEELDRRTVQIAHAVAHEHDHDHDHHDHDHERVKP